MTAFDPEPSFIVQILDHVSLRITQADNCGLSRNRYLQLTVDAERTFVEIVGQLAKY